MHVSEINITPYETYAIDSEEALIIAEPGDGQDALAAIRAIGYHIGGPIGFAEAMHDYTRFDTARLVAIEAVGVPAPLLESVLTRVDALAHARGLAVIATVAPEQIDLAASLLDPDAQLLCAPNAGDWLAAVAMLRWRGKARLHDSSHDDMVLRMRRFQEEVARIADTLARLTRGVESEPEIDGPAVLRNDTLDYRGPPGNGANPNPQEIRRVIRARRMRADFFTGELFADPAWDMLLDLFASELERRPVSVSSLCIAAAVPPTTALRWIGTMHEAGLFERKADPNDRRRAYIALSTRARDGMRNFIGALNRAGLNLV